MSQDSFAASSSPAHVHVAPAALPPIPSVKAPAVHPTGLQDLVAFWDFQADDLVAQGPHATRLHAMNGGPRRASGGVFGSSSMQFTPEGILAGGFLGASCDQAPELNIGGPDAVFTLVAWIYRLPSSYAACQFVAGVWNEHGRRQYGMFLNLGIWDSREQIGAHVSSHGGATPGFPYCMDAAIGATPVSFEQWHCAAIAYDGVRAYSYLDGKLDVREPQGEPGRNPFHYPGGLLKGTAHFTVGAVSRPAAVSGDASGGFVETGDLIANPYSGLLGGLALYRRALAPEELASLAV